MYKLCCEKRFTASDVQIIKAPPRTTLYKYLVIPKEGQPRPLSQLQQPKTPNHEVSPKANPLLKYSFGQPMVRPTNNMQPPEIKRRISHSSNVEQGPRPRSNTLPFADHTEDLQLLSTMRSGNGNGSTTIRRAPHNDQVVEEEEHHQE